MTSFLPQLSLPTAPSVAQVDFAQRLAVDLVAVIILIRGTYYRHYQRTDLFLTFFSFNLVIFLIAHLMTNVQISMGAAFGLFAVFSMLRYRTENISTSDMTYLFMVIALGLLTAVSGSGWLDLVPLGLTLILFTEVLESGIIARREFTQDVHYDNVQLVAESSHAALIDDLRTRTGLDVHRVDVQEMDFLRDAARLRVYYYARKGGRR